MFTEEAVSINDEKEVDNVFISTDVGKEPLQPTSLANLRISEVPMPEVPTTPLLSANSKETFFNQIQIPKKGKTKRRVPQGEMAALTENSKDTVLRDLSNLSLKSTKNTNLKLKDPVNKKVKGGSKMKTKGRVRGKAKSNDEVSKAGVSRRKKAVCPSPVTTDGSLVSCGREEAISRTSGENSKNSSLERGKRNRYYLHY